MSGGWTMGAPRLRRGSSQLVEVTDGNRSARAWCSVPSGDPASKPVAPIWLDEEGVPLGWQPTHWRPAEVSAATFVVE